MASTKIKNKTIKERLNNFNDPNIMYEANLFVLKISKLVYGLLALLVGLSLLYWSYASDNLWVDGTTMIIAAIFLWKATSDLKGWWQIRKNKGLLKVEE